MFWAWNWENWDLEKGRWVSVRCVFEMEEYIYLWRLKGNIFLFFDHSAMELSNLNGFLTSAMELSNFNNDLFYLFDRLWNVWAVFREIFDVLDPQ